MAGINVSNHSSNDILNLQVRVCAFFLLKNYNSKIKMIIYDEIIEKMIKFILYAHTIKSPLSFFFNFFFRFIIYTNYILKERGNYKIT
jgi:hypothetical protein